MKAERSSLPLRDVLTALLPDDRTTLLLRACVQGGASLERAWRDWLRAVDDPRAFLSRQSGLGRLLPLLEANLTRHAVEIGDPLQPYLRTARVHEKLRFRTYQRGFDQTVGLLLRSGVDLTLLKGAALARTVYEPPFLRHCHDLDLLVRNPDWTSALPALEREGYRIAQVAHGTVSARHSSGLAAMLHRTLLASEVYRLEDDDPFRGRHLLALAVGEVRVLSPEDSLVHVLAHAATVARSPCPTWAVDAYRLMTAGDNLDWCRIQRLCSGGNLAPVVEPMLDYLEQRLGAPVPAGLCAELRSVATRSGARASHDILHGVLLARRGLLREALTRGSGRARWAIARQLCLPPRRATVRLVSSFLRRRMTFPPVASREARGERDDVAGRLPDAKTG